MSSDEVVEELQKALHLIDYELKCSRLDMGGIAKSSYQVSLTGGRKIKMLLMKLRKEALI